MSVLGCKLNVSWIWMFRICVRRCLNGCSTSRTSTRVRKDRGHLWIGYLAVCIRRLASIHYGDVMMGAIASQITNLTMVYSTIYSDADQRKHQSSASLAFVWGIHRGPVNSQHKWPVTRKMFPFGDVIMCWHGAGPGWNTELVSAILIDKK